MATTQPQVKNPTLAAILSFLINGLGQIYNGEVVKGLVIIGVQIVNALLTTIIIGFVTGFIVFVWSVYDAYKTAEKINAQAAQQAIADTKVCPRCAERVNSGARICHHCGYEFMPEQPLLTTTNPVALPAVTAATPVMVMSVPADAGMKFCSNCGKQVKADARFCQHCGYRFDAVASEDAG